jgi:hypothetical protein
MKGYDDWNLGRLVRSRLRRSRAERRIIPRGS